MGWNEIGLERIIKTFFVELKRMVELKRLVFGVWC
jgi:hypothetical protein